MDPNKDKLTLGTFIRANQHFSWFDTSIKPGVVTLNRFNMMMSIYHGRPPQ